MATENLEKQIDFLALLIIFLIISLFGYNLYSQPTKKNKRLLPRPVTGESTAGEELRNKGPPTRGERKELGSVRDPPNPYRIHPGTTTRLVKSRPVKSRVGS